MIHTLFGGFLEHAVSADRRLGKGTESGRGEGSETFEEAAERGGIGITEVVTDLLDGEVGTSGKQVLGPQTHGTHSITAVPW